MTTPRKRETMNINDYWRQLLNSETFESNPRQKLRASSFVSVIRPYVQLLYADLDTQVAGAVAKAQRGAHLTSQQTCTCASHSTATTQYVCIDRRISPEKPRTNKNFLHTSSCILRPPLQYHEPRPSANAHTGLQHLDTAAPNQTVAAPELDFASLIRFLHHMYSHTCKYWR